MKKDGPAHAEIHVCQILESVSLIRASPGERPCPAGPTYQPKHALGARAAASQMSPNLTGNLVTAVH